MTMITPTPTELEIEEAANDLAKRFTDPKLPLLDLYARGLIVAYGRNADGHLAWAAADMSLRH